MRYVVRVTAEAEQAMLAQAQFIAADKPAAAAEWLAELHEAVESPESMPRRHAVAGELSDALGCEVRRMVVGAYLVFFLVDDDAGVVDVLHFRHGARQPPTAE